MRAQNADGRREDFASAVIAGFAAFSLYFCMYAFRKPFIVAQFEGLDVLGIDYKVVLLLCQVGGYAISKFFGIKFISELKANQRAWCIIGCITMAGFSLLGFALAPYPWNAIFMFLNGLPLGLIWGLVFSYLEGRQTTEIMAAILSASFILASGVVKSIGQWLMLQFHMDQFWMPVTTAVLFLVPLLGFLWLLSKTPPPTQADIEARNMRVPMNARDRQKLFLSLAPGLIAFILLYMFITAFRDMRDNFSVEVWEEMGVKENAAVFTQSELPIALLVLVLFALFFLVRNNYKAFKGMQLLICGGLACIAVVNFLFSQGIFTSPMLWTMSIGALLYTAYFPYNSMLFERLMATYRCKGNAGFLIYLADAFGYLGSILVLLYKEFFYAGISYLGFFIEMGYMLGIAGIVGIVFTQFYFKRKLQQPPYPSISASYHTSTS